MPTHTAETSPLLYARLAGLLWLLNVVTTAFSLGYVRPQLIVFGDASVTVGNIVANEPLFRAAIVSNLFTNIFLFFFGLTVYHLFKEVHRGLALMFLTSVMITVAIAVVNALNHVGVLMVLGETDYLKAFNPEQLNVMAMVFLRLNNSGQGLLELFWAPYLFSFALLIIKSRFLPRILGILLILMSFGFPLNTFTKLLVPEFYPAMFTQLAMLLGALAGIPTILWLLIKGVNTGQWEKRALESA